jgi:hypothetical protein
MARIPRIRSIDANHCFATWDRVLLQIWRGEATLEAAKALQGIGAAFIKECAGQSCNSLSIVESTSPPPADKVRPVLSACYRDFAPNMRHQFFVAEGSGFRVALVRGVGLAVSALAPRLLPFKFASSIEEAARAMEPMLSQTSGGAAGLEAAVEQLRQELNNVSHSQ